ncbi:MAG: molybdopterin-dependent oxidoreductase [Anaerolineae bacterium]
MAKLNMVVNGEEVSVEADGGDFLAYLLRYKLGLTGTKIGCDEAECGACTVLVDGRPVDSCVYPALKAQGAEIQTIEGLAHNGDLHPLQRAFVERGAVQCGFCTPGFIMTSKALLERNPLPTDADIKAALKDTYCRCGCYVEIIDAVHAAAGELAGSDRDGRLPVSPKALNVVGRPVARPDAVAKVTGQARFTDDFSFPDMLYGATLRAKYPHALIKSIDAHQAQSLPGVHAVLTAGDIPGEKNHGLVFNDWPALADGKVRYFGDPVAIVAADAQEIAEQALELIEVEYEPLPVVSSPEAALAEDAPQIHPAGNLLKHIKVRLGDVEQGFEEADVIVEREYTTPIYEHAFLEPECSIGRIAEDGKIEVIVGSQIPYEDRRQVAACLGVPEEQVRVKGAIIGGGFGGKEDIAGQIHAALLAQKTGRPVKILYSRQESLRFHPKRHATKIRLKTGARRDGRLVAVRAEIWGDGGAYASLSDKVMTRAATHAAGPYKVPNVKIDCYTAYTNNPPAGAFRGFGVTQSAFAVESNMDLVAEALGMDPVEFRRTNALRVGSTASTGQVLRESVGLVECLDRVEGSIKEIGDKEEGETADPRLPIVASEPNLQSAICNLQSNRVRAWGIAACYKNTGLGGGAADKGGAEVEVFEDGRAVVRTASAEIGQGLPAVLAIVTSEELGIPIDHIEVAQPDTDVTPDGGPTTASRQTYIAGNAARLASAQVRDILAWAACESLGASQHELEFRDGYVYADGRSMSIGEAVQLAREGGRPALAREVFQAPETQPLGTGGDMHVAFSYGVQAAQVEVDLETGEVVVLRVVNAHDIGRVINMLGLLGQIRGGIIMGLGIALTERFPVENGIPFCNTFSKYKMPGIRHTPEIVTHLVEHEVSSGPYGAKGVGEIASIATTPAITNAIYNAAGIRVYDLPVDQDWMLRQLKTPSSSAVAKAHH